MYEKLIKALLSASTVSTAWGKLMQDAAAAIEALNRLVELNTERCEGLREQLRKAQEQYEKHLNELEQQLPKRGDMVEVVRCKDCIHFVQNGWCDREFDWFPVDEMDFCSSAEKMEVQDANT